MVASQRSLERHQAAVGVRHHVDWLVDERHHGEQIRDLVRKRVVGAAVPAGAVTAPIDGEQRAGTLELGRTYPRPCGRS